MRIQTHVAIAAAVIMMAGMAAAAPDGLLPEAHAQFQSGGVDREGSWYVGEGLKQGDYFSYSMCHVDYKECSKFRMDFWISGDMQVGSETKWRAEMVVYDGNRVAKGHMELGKIAPEPTGGTEELGVYRGAFKSSIAWLSAFATANTDQGGKGPKEFKATSWGKIGNIGGEQVMPQLIEEVRAAGETWDAVQVGWRTGGYSSKIWIVDEFPFPIKAKTFTHVSEGIPPKEYEFVLQRYEEGVTENPFSSIASTAERMENMGCEAKFNKDTTIKKSTVGAMYQIHVAYGPEDPKQGCSMEWLIKFISKYDETEFLNQVHFDVLTLNEDKSRDRSLAAEEGRQFLYSPSGQYLIDIPVLEEPGDTSYVILVYGRAPENIIPTDQWDFAEIPITIYKGEDAPGHAGNEEVILQDQPQESSIPAWIKTNAGWWAEGIIDDDTFVQGLQYLINRGIIQIPPTDGADGADTPQGIPAWIKTNAGWWAEGTIDDDTFVQAIQYLIRNGIMVIS